MTPVDFCGLFLACREGRAWAVANCATMDDAWATARPDWLVWIATRRGVLDERTLRLFAVWCARQVQHLMTDPRSVAALDVAERHANRQATDEDLRAAWVAARAAAWVAAGVAAWDAARVAAGAAAGDATWDAAWDAARVAAWDAAGDATWDAARVAAWDAQAAWLRANATPDWERALRMGGAR
jgi:hypothetical protein